MPCRYQATDPRYAALKAASKGVEEILLRQTSTRMMFEYRGKVVTLDTPKEITRGDPPRTITYNKRPSVQFVRKFPFDDKSIEQEEKEEKEEEPAKPKAKRTRVKKAPATPKDG